MCNYFHFQCETIPNRAGLIQFGGILRNLLIDNKNIFINKWVS